MRFIETKTHGYLDYIVGILLLILPALMGWDLNEAQSIVPMALGAGVIVYSLMTAYELGAAKVISMSTHLTIDFISGVFLAASPWIFNFDEIVYLPHLIVGILEIGAALMTKTQTTAAGVHTDHHMV